MLHHGAVPQKRGAIYKLKLFWILINRFTRISSFLEMELFHKVLS